MSSIWDTVLCASNVPYIDAAISNLTHVLTRRAFNLITAHLHMPFSNGT
jgi:hypothetical protein